MEYKAGLKRTKSGNCLVQDALGDVINLTMKEAVPIAREILTEDQDDHITDPYMAHREK